MHLAVVLVARLRLGLWLGLTGLAITALAVLIAAAAAGMAAPTDHVAPAGGYHLPLPTTPTDPWIAHSARAMADNAAPIVVIIGALISSWFAVHNARPR